MYKKCLEPINIDYMIYELEEVGIDCMFGRISYSMLFFIDILVKLAVACMGDPRKQASKGKKRNPRHICVGDCEVDYVLCNHMACKILLFQPTHA